MSVSRKFPGTSTEMLISASSISQAAITHQVALTANRPIWTLAYFQAFQTRIDTAVSTYLGVDNAATLRAQTSVVLDVFKSAYANISTIKLEIEEGFKDNKPRKQEILNTLGYNLYWIKSQKGKDQEALISLLFAFKQNLTPAIQAEITAKGSLPATLTAITDAAQALMDANVSQESIKQSKKALTDTATIEFNAIYDELISICKLARRYLKDLSGVPDQFSYSKAIAALNSGTITTLYDEILVFQPGSLNTISQVKLTAKTRLTLTLLYNLDGVYACRNTDGCYPSQSQKLQFEIPVELTKATLQGTGNYLLISNPLAEDAKVQIKIQG